MWRQGNRNESFRDRGRDRYDHQSRHDDRRRYAGNRRDSDYSRGKGHSSMGRQGHGIGPSNHQYGGREAPGYGEFNNSRGKSSNMRGGGLSPSRNQQDRRYSSTDRSSRGGMGKQNQTLSAPRASSLASGTQGPGKPVRTIIQFAQRSITGMLTMHNAAGFWSPESLQHLANMTWVVTGARCVLMRNP